MSPVEHEASDTSHCPLCGQANECAIVAGYPPESCWCMKESISPEALARVPDEQQGKSCICPQCARPVTTSA
ncbi:cysteine-rich CWC family protein [Diaphorobacter aerolatus]|uniref:Cysteine-rich CWC family protein n=1 Tax=Diaphorobacter aerolatus TaxID=1288495 RepID=A0A7H0GPU9_9BURK|nr:cysteine-rich CWC family protein [Diaphorobacter aerolatus]QNP50315.1 cysteine-rich CWC family protein [Diaphorobacter aerolatus]